MEPKARRSGLATVMIAWLAGTVLATLGQSLLFPGIPPLDFLAEKFSILGYGTVIVHALALPLFILWRMLRGNWPTAGRVVLMMLVVGMAPMLAMEIGKDRHMITVAAVGFLLAAFVPGIPALSGRVAALLLAAGLALPLGFAGWQLAGGGGAPELPPAVAADTTATGPDVLLISIDTLRADTLLEEGLPLPNLERLRRMGRTADYGLAPAPNTLPSHVTMLTGRGVNEHGALDNLYRVPRQLPLLAERLQDAGWRTAAVVSNGMLRSWVGFDRGFDAYDDSMVVSHGSMSVLRRHIKGRSWTGRFLDRTRGGERRGLLASAVSWLQDPIPKGRRTLSTALQYLERLQAHEAPYFLFVHFMDPHSPYDPDESVAGRLTERRPVPELITNLLEQGGQVEFELADRLAKGPDPQAQEAAAYLHQIYREEVLYMDACLGHLLDALEHGSRETLIVLTSDHGEQFGEHELMLHSNSLYETLLRVPFYLAGPGVSPDSRFRVVPQLEDIVPTILAACGLDTGELPGRDLRQEDLSERLQIALRAGMVSVREHPWKLIAWVRGLGSEELEIEPFALYDTARDPLEQANLLESEVARVQRLHEAAQLLLQRMNMQAEADLSERERALFEELGYLGEGAHDH